MNDVNARGGHTHWKVVRGCAAVMTPLFSPVDAPLPTNLHYLPSMRRLRAPIFNFLEKNAFSALFWQKPLAL